MSSLVWFPLLALGRQDGSTQVRIGLVSYLAAVGATRQVPGTKLGGFDPAVEILVPVAHLVFDHGQLGLLEKASTESPCEEQQRRG